MNPYSIRCRSSFSILSLQGRFMAARRLLARGRPCGGAEHFVNDYLENNITLDAGNLSKIRTPT